MNCYNLFYFTVIILCFLTFIPSYVLNCYTNCLHLWEIILCRVRLTEHFWNFRTYVLYVCTTFYTQDVQKIPAILQVSKGIWYTHQTLFVFIVTRNIDIFLTSSDFQSLFDMFKLSDMFLETSCLHVRNKAVWILMFGLKPYINNITHICMFYAIQIWNMQGHR
jgi:hypothetical protein